VTSTPRDRSTVLLVDGTSLVYRAFFAISNLTAPDGRPTNAVYGFINMILRLIEDAEGDRIIVAFDRGAPRYRLEVYPDYKGHRPEMPEDLRPQFDLVKQVLDGFGIPRVEVDGVEADDILGTLARRLEALRIPARLVTGDKDLLQLVTEYVEVALTRRGITEMDIYDLDRVREEYGVEPPMLVDVKALMGDTSDNIPGVPGIGEKTALKLVKNIGKVEEVLAEPERAGGKVIPERLREHVDAVRVSRTLAEIHTDIPLDLDVQDLDTPTPDADVLADTLSVLGFTQILKRLDLRGRGCDLEPIPVEQVEEGRGLPPGGVDPGDVHLSLDYGWDGENVSHIAIAQDATKGLLFEAESHDLRSLVRELVGRKDIKIAGHALGRILAWAHVDHPEASLFDAELAAYLLDPARSSYPLEDLAPRYLETSALSAQDHEDAPRDRVGLRLLVLRQLPEKLWTEMKALGLDSPLFTDIEMPLVPILARMKIHGIIVDPDVLIQQDEALQERLNTLQSEIWELAGREFNVSSPKQLGQVLFDELELPVIKRTKTGYSTDADVLGQLVPKYPIAGLVLEYRSLAKLRGYVSGLLDHIDPETGRIHTTFHQVVTATGRLSSADPNLQNIPIREATGRKLRRAFMAPPGKVLVAADYSQIELRILAHFSCDETLVQAFAEKQDIHRRTASEVFGVAMADVTAEMRTAAKEVNFGIMYGMSGFGLSQSLQIPPDEAQRYIDEYLARMPGVKRYMDRTVEKAREQGYVSTLFGRIRYLPDLHHRVYHRRRLAERMALNTPIQGTAADIIKKAMVDLEVSSGEQDELLLLQVHDELIWEVPEDLAISLAARVRATMENTTALRVPMQVDVKVGPNWFDMRPLDVDQGDA